MGQKGQHKIATFRFVPSTHIFYWTMRLKDPLTFQPSKAVDEVDDSLAKDPGECTHLELSKMTESVQEIMELCRPFYCPDDDSSFGYWTVETISPRLEDGLALMEAEKQKQLKNQENAAPNQVS